MLLQSYFLGISSPAAPASVGLEEAFPFDIPFKDSPSDQPTSSMTLQDMFLAGLPSCNLLLIFFFCLPVLLTPLLQ